MTNLRHHQRAADHQRAANGTRSGAGSHRVRLQCLKRFARPDHVRCAGERWRKLTRHGNRPARKHRGCGRRKIACLFFPCAPLGGCLDGATKTAGASWAPSGHDDPCALLSFIRSPHLAAQADELGLTKQTIGWGIGEGYPKGNDTLRPNPEAFTVCGRTCAGVFLRKNVGAEHHNLPQPQKGRESR